MKKIISILGILFASQSYAADIIVQQSGPTGTYGSISSAVTAAADGDRILVNNRLDNLPWVEDVLINKSISLLSAVDNQMFFVNGEYTIERAAGRQVSIVGMRNNSTSTNIKSSGPNDPIRTKVKLVANNFAGDVFQNYSTGMILGGIDLYFGQNQATNLCFSYGKAIGNKLNYILLISDPVSNSDTVFVIGNDVSSQFTAFNSSNSTQNIYMANNYMESNSTSIYTSVVEFTDSPKPNSIIENCTFDHKKYDYAYSASVNYCALKGFDNFVINSILDGIVKDYDASKFLYNICSGTILPAAQNNQNIKPIPIYQDHSSSSSSQNTGNPSNQYLDLDLTRNDIGCFGGSNSFANYHPIDDGKSSRVSFVTTPRVLYQGETFTPSVIGFDK